MHMATTRVRTLVLAALLAAAVCAVWLCCAAITLCVLSVHHAVTSVNRHTANAVLAPRPLSPASSPLSCPSASAPQWTVLAAHVRVDRVCRLINQATNIRATVLLIVPHTAHNAATAVFTTRAAMTVTLLPHSNHTTLHTLFSAAQMAYLDDVDDSALAKRKKLAPHSLRIVVFDSVPTEQTVVDALCSADSALASTASVEIVVDASSEKPLQIGTASLDIYVTKRLVVLRVLARYGITAIWVITSSLCAVVSSCLAVAFVVVRMFGTSLWATVVSSRSADQQTINSAIGGSAAIGGESSSTGVANANSTACRSTQNQS